MAFFDRLAEDGFFDSYERVIFIGFGPGQWPCGLCLLRRSTPARSCWPAHRPPRSIPNGRATSAGSCPVAGAISGVGGGGRASSPGRVSAATAIAPSLLATAAQKPPHWEFFFFFSSLTIPPTRYRPPMASGPSSAVRPSRSPPLALTGPAPHRLIAAGGPSAAAAARPRQTGG